MASAMDRVAFHAERIVYRAGGLPIALAGLFGRGGGSPARRLHRAYAGFFWRPARVGDALELAAALCLWPVLLLFSGTVLTVHNGRTIARRHGRSVLMQIFDQLRLYVTAGVLPPWYYIYSLHDAPLRRAIAQYMTRSETKLGIYDMLHPNPPTLLSDKEAFARHCQQHELPGIPVLATARNGEVIGLQAPGQLPRCDLFVKPARGSGGNGAERWNHAGGNRYRRADGLELDSDGLLAHLRVRSMQRTVIVQPRVRNHADLADLSNGGALSTVRALTCINEAGRPEVVAAVLRMAVGTNTTVDNFHAGGIAADIDLDSGILSKASDLGMFTKQDWLAHQPMTGAPIAGRRVPQWAEVRALAERAHATFGDRILVGWDIAISDAGVILVEGNSGPDVDIHQRVHRGGMFAGRFGPLLDFHVARRAATGQPG